MFCLKTLLAIERRCLIPCSPTALRGKEEISKLIFPHIKVLLTVFEYVHQLFKIRRCDVILFLRLITSFWKPDVFVSIEPEFQGVFSLTASENKSLLGVPTRRGEDTDSDALLDRAHVLLVNTMDVWYSLVEVDLPVIFTTVSAFRLRGRLERLLVLCMGSTILLARFC